MDLALNNLQRLICHKTQQTKPNLYTYRFRCVNCCDFKLSSSHIRFVCFKFCLLCNNQESVGSPSVKKAAHRFGNGMLYCWHSYLKP